MTIGSNPSTVCRLDESSAAICDVRAGCALRARRSSIAPSGSRRHSRGDPPNAGDHRPSSRRARRRALARRRLPSHAVRVRERAAPPLRRCSEARRPTPTAISLAAPLLRLDGGQPCDAQGAAGGGRTPRLAGRAGTGRARGCLTAARPGATLPATLTTEVMVGSSRPDRRPAKRSRAVTERSEGNPGEAGVDGPASAATGRRRPAHAS